MGRKSKAEEKSALYNNYEWLYNNYIILKRSTKAMAEDAGCAKCTIVEALKRFNIAIKPAHRPSNAEKPPIYYDYNYLYEEYVIKGRSAIEIGADFGVSDDTIYKALDFNKIDRYHHSAITIFSKEQEQDIVNSYTNYESCNSISKRYNVPRKAIMRVLNKYNINIRNYQEAQFAVTGRDVPDEYLDYEYMYERYINNHEGTENIASDLGVNQTTIRNQLKRLNIDIDHSRSSPKYIFERDNYNSRMTLYQLSRSYFYYNLRPIVLQRDKYTCQKCGAINCELHVHHKISFDGIIKGFVDEHPELDENTDYGKAELYRLLIQDDRFNNLNNCITLCKYCHQHSEDHLYMDIDSPELRFYRPMVKIINN